MTISASEGDKEYNGKLYHTFPTAIIAEKSFYENGTDDGTKATDPDNAAYLFINATYGCVPTTYKILLREGDANFRLLRNTNYNVYATIKQIGSKGIYVVIEPVKLYNITVNWKPVEGLVIVSDREADFNKNVNVWSDYTAYSGILKVYKGDGFKTIVIYAKMMRGVMTRYILKNKISHPDDICSFSAEGFHFSPEHSSENNPVFVV